MPDDTTPRILNFVVDESLLGRLDDFRFERRFGTRAAAVKWLIEYALKNARGMRGRSGDKAAPATKKGRPA